ncbi:hypothetical protein B0A50_05471 [Salinomyces thailandicus]|uniref:Myb-like domain-containing protein n=1 Tax=Salinomyces thailandicus TaxID=706561 RepID=A0A4V5N6I0_9PEZI|nr:hypothetical protein B0A50_05471 [Salinomyces thailandica]
MAVRSAGAHENGQPSSQIYKPTSLGFINRPNPVEPQSVPQRHPLNGTPQLAQPPQHGFECMLPGVNGGSFNRPAKRRKSGDGKLLDLPRLPVRHNAKRLRIPPTLSGLHQPPPDAGLLPSISTEQPVAPPKRTVVTVDERPTKDQPEGSQTKDGETITLVHDKTKKSQKPKRNKWSDDETACLLKGVARFGIGNWTAILQCPDYRFDRRTALHLKDRFRVCRPEEYLRTRQAGNDRPGQSTDTSSSPSQSQGRTAPKKSDRKSDIELHRLGITQPFAKTERRTRHNYTETEDQAILAGFRKYGNSWASIRSDKNLGLDHRTATDLRDRLRTKYPIQYAEAGLTPRPEAFPRPKAPRDGDREDSQDPEERTDRLETAELALDATGSTTAASFPQSATKKPISASFLPSDSVFFGAPFEDEEGDFETEPITLDRGILQWAGDNTRQNYFGHPTGSTIDPLSSLRLPAPTGLPHKAAPHSSSGVLPSVADITAYGPQESPEHMELPSLIMRHFDTDGKGSGDALEFDRLLN